METNMGEKPLHLSLRGHRRRPLETGGRSDSSSDLSDSRKAEDSLTEELEGKLHPHPNPLPSRERD